MEAKDITLLLINALLVIVIVAVYIHVAHLIKDQGIAIQVIDKRTKETMSMAQRYGLAARYVGERNYLLPDDKQMKPGNAYPLITNQRGNVDCSQFRKSAKTEVPMQASTASSVAANLGVDVATAIQNGASTNGAAKGLEANGTIEATPEVAPPVTQNGLIDYDAQGAQEGFRGFVNNRAEPMGLMQLTTGGASPFKSVHSEI